MLSRFLFTRISFLTLMMVMFSTSYATDDTLSVVKERGELRCGVSQGLAGFSSPDDKGRWEGFDVDYCRALASAIFNDPNKVQFVPLSAKERFTALQSGEVDILSRNTTWTFTRDTTLGLNFIGVLYYDGQGFMVPKALGVNSAKELNGAIICTNAGTTTELNIADYFRANHMEYEIITFEKSDETVSAYEAGRCDVYSTDRSGLAAQRLRLKDQNAHIILDDVISKEPLGPVIRQGDDIWADIARWVLFALITADEYGITSGNLKEKMASTDPNIQRFIGNEAHYGSKIGLSDRWAAQIIEQVGNYGEIFERNVGQDSPLGLSRGFNASYKEGGILYAPPIR